MPKPILKEKSNTLKSAEDLTSTQKPDSYVKKITHWTKLESKKNQQEILRNQDQNHMQQPDEQTITHELIPVKEKKKLKPSVHPNEEKPKLKKIHQDSETSETPLDMPQFAHAGGSFSEVKPPNPISKYSEKLALPSFLSRFSNQAESNHFNKGLALKNNQNQANSTVDKQPEPGNRLNSFTSVFKRDQDEIQNIKRVFRKSIVFLTLSLLTFGISALLSSIFKVDTVLPFALTSLAYIAVANIFFIIVAHRTYVWLFLLGEIILVLITQFPFSFNIPTIITGFAIATLTYLAYLDLEKVQLGSRLFSIPYVISESTKILTTVLILLVCLSCFNQVYSNGIDKFVAEALFQNKTVMENSSVLYSNIILKEYGVSPINLTDSTSNPTLQAVLCTENKIICSGRSKNILSPAQIAAADKGCKENQISDLDCDSRKEKLEIDELNSLKNKDFPGLNYNLDTKVDSTNYQAILSQAFQNRIKNLTNTSKLSFIPSAIPVKYVIPLAVSISLFILLSIFKFIFVWVAYIVTWIFWKLLQLTGFARLDIEMVEAEIVGI